MLYISAIPFSFLFSSVWFKSSIEFHRVMWCGLCWWLWMNAIVTDLVFLPCAHTGRQIISCGTEVPLQLLLSELLVPFTFYQNMEERPITVVYVEFSYNTYKSKKKFHVFNINIFNNDFGRGNTNSFFLSCLKLDLLYAHVPQSVELESTHKRQV